MRTPSRELSRGVDVQLAATRPTHVAVWPSQGGRQLLKPKFVSKEERETIAERERLEKEEEVFTQRSATFAPTTARVLVCLHTHARTHARTHTGSSLVVCHAHTA
jgi:hypothetical protein